ncbi:Rothmund-thomson syndrome DNA helicase recq4 [Operophtera brumata]|uniref:DNA 3'-5' helicase n=1 Tax=Operophtera brumata TaxID=104452 RepID=A0A0L7LL98_OPEBR|nr:Rothmund-thomson syndrome DNA helicase recq4 [Operophtera brumata]
MDLIESIKKDKAYLKCKQIVKTWEKDFKGKHSRIPSKFDIKEAPAKIKYAYKKYFQLKSSALENSLSISEFDEEPIRDEKLPSLEPDITELENNNFEVLSPTDQLLSALPSGQQLEKLLSDPKPLDTTITQTLHPFTENLSKKLFQNRKFQLRNPRKLSLPRTNSTVDNKINNSSAQEDNSENYFSCFSKDKKDTPNDSSSLDLDSTPDFSFSLNVSNPVGCTKSPSVRQLNAAWLDRATGLHADDITKPTNVAEKFGLRNINVPIVESVVTKACDYVENSESEGEDIDKIKPALKKRKIRDPLPEKITNDVVLEKSGKSKQKLKSSKSEDENQESNEAKSKKKKLKAIKADDVPGEQQPPDIKEYMPFGLEDVTPRHSQVSNILKSIDSLETTRANNGFDYHAADKLEKDMQNCVSQETSEEKSVTDQLCDSLFESSKIPESFMRLLGESGDGSDLKPVYQSYEHVDSKDIHEALHMFGHGTFRPGQEDVIKRILCGMSTLLILPTGGGKSLCYQLPAYLNSKHQKCLTLVISPLVSLMEDQVLNMPEFLKAGCLHTNQPPTQRRKILECLKDGEINILLISPEALISGDNSNGFAGLFKSLPPIAFACIDEAHCVSHWSHNFRPSYLMICRVLREKLNVKCILGLTATASQTTIKSIINHIDILDGVNGVITNPSLPDNLHLSVSFERDKDRALISYLSSDKICEYNSIIVYCIRRDECERVAAIIRSCFQESGKNNMEQQKQKRKRMSYTAEAYHAGMSAAQRKKIQKHFMDGTLRVIVATVAFGMGINKSDIRCIIHYNMPSSFESYVQEVGRAGRDSKPANCHVFINNSSHDVDELLKHIYSNSIDRPNIRKLLQKVFIPCDCSKSQNSSSSSSPNCQCKGHEVGIPIDATVEELDLPAENIATLLCYVELHPKKYIKVLNNAYTMCKISSYGGPQKILEAAKTCSPLAMAYLLESKKDSEILKQNVLEFNVIEVASAVGWESGMTKYHLKNLEWISEGGTSKRSHLKVEFNTLGFRIKSRGDLTPSELDSILDDLHESVVFQEKARLYQLEECSIAFKTLGNYSLGNSNLRDDILLEKSNELKRTIRSYFQRENCLPENMELEKRPLDKERIANDVRALIASYKDCTFTGRSIAKIFQGISSPNFQAIVWGRCKFWRSHIQEDFNGIIKIATQQLIQMKM